MQVEADRRPPAIADILQESSLGCLESPGITVDIDPLSVPTLKAFGTVRIEHRNDVQREPREELLDGRFLLSGAQEFEEVEQG